MSRAAYWRDHLPFLLAQAAGLVLLSLFLLLNKCAAGAIVLIDACWLAAVLCGISISCHIRRHQLDRILKMTKQLDERYLAAELIQKPRRAEDQVYYQVLKLSGKSMLEQVGRAKREQTEYREYIEQWTHEIKTPLTAMELLIENHPSELTKTLRYELEALQRYTRQALYYARSNCAEQDYFIKETDINGVIHQAIADNSRYLMRHDFGIEIGEGMGSVFTDGKWLRFILDQLIANAVKYRGAQPLLRFFERDEAGRHTLSVADNGIGIPVRDLTRVFEKGFTGENGRKTEHATGIGLYLVRKLCDKLDIAVSVTSGGTGCGTTVQLSFHENDYITSVQG